MRLTGSADEKLAWLDAVRGFADLGWAPCLEGWHEPLLPTGSGDYYSWPLLTDIFPWQYSGLQAKRTWPIGPDVATLELRWQGLLGAIDRRAAMRVTSQNQLDRAPGDLLTGRTLEPLRDLPPGTEPIATLPYSYRSFDRQWLLADARLLDRPRPPLWYVHSRRQVYLSSLLTGVLGTGPAAMATAHIPDLHHFRGSFGGKDVIPLWRDADASEPNVTGSLLAALGEGLGCEVGPEDLFAFCYALLASPDYVDRFSEELTIPGPRVPLTKDPTLFRHGAALGADLIRLHTYGQRFQDAGSGDPLQGCARCTRSVGETVAAYPDDFEYNESRQTLRVGAGEFGRVRPEVWEFSVSGFQVVKSWLGYRMREGAGRRSSPLDEIRPTRWTAQFTRELLELLWVLEGTVERQPALAELLEAVVAGACYGAEELPAPEARERAAPRVRRAARRDGTYAQANL